MTDTSERLRRAMDEGPVIAYFGYGSLVNRMTLRTDYVAAEPARLNGWRRCCRPRSSGDPIDARRRYLMLSARKRAGHAIDGLLVYDRLDHLPEIDRREASYDWVTVSLERLELNGSAPHDCPIYIYEAPRIAPHDPGVPILQSYLDAVMQGFLHEFGEKGVHGFLHSTDGFDRPVRADRHEPVYSRAVELPDYQRSFFDTLLGPVDVQESHCDWFPVQTSRMEA